MFYFFTSGGLEINQRQIYIALCNTPSEIESNMEFEVADWILKRKFKNKKLSKFK